MTLVVAKIEPAGVNGDYAVWEEILHRKDRYSFFQTPRWQQLLENVIPKAVPAHKYLIFSDGVAAILPLFQCKKRFGFHKWESLPWGTYGDLISESPVTMAHRICAMESLLSLRSPIAEMMLSPLAEVDPNVSLQSKSRYTHILELTDEISFRQNIQSRTRSAIHKALESGVKTGWSNDTDRIRQAKDLYQKACLRWEGIETVPLAFFDRLENLPGEEIRVWFARKEDHILAMDVILYGKKEAQYFIGASDPAYSSLQGPKLLMAEIISDAVRRGYAGFNFGSSGNLEGVAQFKRHFGGIHTEYRQCRFIYPLLRFLY